MIIPCSDNCVHQKEGLCTLTRIESSSDTPLKDCPYYRDKEKGKEKNKMENK